MLVTGIAINADAGRLDGQAENLVRELDYFLKLGFTQVEIAPHGAGVIFNGALHQARMAEFSSILARYPFKYLVHGPNPLNLMNLEDLELEKNMFQASLEFTAAIGANVMVYHAGRYLPEEEFLLPRNKKITPLEKKKMWDTERDLLWEMGEKAYRLGVTIGVENARPYMDASPYCYGEDLKALAAMIHEVDHPCVGITLDVGHAHLSASYYSFDLLSGIEVIAPYVKHIHLHDNFGKSGSSYERKQYEAAATGRGDMHMPIGWGSIPAREIFQRLPDYQGAVTLEMRPRYRAYYAEALANARALLEDFLPQKEEIKADVV
ncbi:MAG: endonuclease [Peptococcaceae bacterium]|jgi:sugar phosphate isomerase/epimerase|nr:endonuclease [Peptococcaceae bacterium]